MIVICTKCAAKFRVADERIGPRGAKVRCSRCQTVFHVAGEHSAAPAAPASRPRPAALDVELENPFAAGGASPRAPKDDPFAAAGFGPPVPPPLPARPDPFVAAAAAAPAPPADDPFAPATPRPDDPFAPRHEPDPFAALDAASSAAAAPAPAEPDGGGLALEERLTPPPLPTARLAPEPGDHLPPPVASEGFTMGADPNTFDAYDFGASGPALALATEPDAGSHGAPEASPHPAAAEAPSAAAPQPAPVAAAVSGTAVAPAPAAPPAAVRAVPAPLAVPPAAADLATGPMPARRESRLRAAAVNAVALLALLVVTLAFLVVWRSDGGAERLSLRPGAILAALGRGGPDRPFTAVEVRSGVYERERGPPVLFVRGKVVSHAAAPVRAVRVRVEVVRSDAVLARGEALAGAVPTPEEMYRAGDEGGVAALARAAAARAPRQIRPGDAVPFLVPIADAPADLDGASVRVELASGAAASP
jgi:predicted Zn finger-like uncharacterized protein